MATNLSNLTNFLNPNPLASEIKEEEKRTHPITPEEILIKAKEMHIETNPLDIKKVAEEMFKMKICPENLGKSVSGFLERIGENWCIYVNQYESMLRQRFTIAHELGHFILHKDKIIAQGASAPDQIFFRSDNVDFIEQEANNFASELLMPKEEFKNAIKNGVNTFEKLSEKFELSTSAVKYRAYKLGIITEYV